MNVFHTHSSIVSDSATYIRSFLKVVDPQIREVVEGFPVAIGSESKS